MRYLTRAEVRRCCEELDPLAETVAALAHHARGDVVLPAEAALWWTTTGGAAARSLAMPAAVTAGRFSAGVKIINASLENANRHIPRAHGLFLLIDRDTAVVTALMDAAHISALRTASLSAVAVQTLATAHAERVAIIGAGAIARAHVQLLPRVLPRLRAIAVYDQVEARARELVEGVEPMLGERAPQLAVCATAREAIEEAGVVIAATTTTTGYIPYDWLAPGTVLVNVSLDDVLPDVVELADLLFVDDWSLVRADDRRLLGRLYRAGRLQGPDESEEGASDEARRVTATLGDVIIGRHPGRARDDEVVLVNPFGMALLDLQLAGRVCERAEALNVGKLLEA